MMVKINLKYFQKILVIVLLFVGVLNYSFSQEPYQVRMAMVGNSITYGSALPSPSTQNYTVQLDNMLSQVYGDTVEIRNYGVSGRTMLQNSGNSIWGEIKFRQAVEFVPDVCVILLGTNDSRPDYWDPYGDEFLDDYLAMIDTFQFRNPDTKFIVCYPPPVFPDAPYTHSNETIENEIIPLIDSVVTMTGATLMDFHYVFSDSIHLFPDKLHPDSTGAGYMAQMLFDTLISQNIIDEVETGQAFVSTFKQSPTPVEVGTNVNLQWTTIFADSVFLDGVPVDILGNTQVVAEDKVYILTAKGASNSSDYPLQLITTPSTVSTENLALPKVEIFPNPVSDQLVFKLKNISTSSAQLRIYNIFGQQVFEKKLDELNNRDSKFEMNTSHLEKGAYVYFLVSESNILQGQFYKMRD